MSGPDHRTGVAWLVTFKRDRLVASYKHEEMVVVAPEGQLQLLLDGVRSIHPEAIVVTADHLGDAVWSA